MRQAAAELVPSLVQLLCPAPCPAALRAAPADGSSGAGGPVARAAARVLEAVVGHAGQGTGGRGGQGTWPLAGLLDGAGPAGELRRLWLEVGHGLGGVLLLLLLVLLLLLLVLLHVELHVAHALFLRMRCSCACAAAAAAFLRMLLVLLA